MNLYERNKNIKEFFNQKIDTYDLVHEKFMATKSLIANYLPRDSKHILDLGVGTGLELIPIFEKFNNLKVTGIDISKNMLEKLKTREFYNKVDIIYGDFFEVSFGSNYDVVISTSALHHFFQDDKVKLYQKIYDSLKYKGKFINADKIALSKDDESNSLKDYYDNKDNKPHIDTPLTIEHELEILKKVGFKEIKVLKTDIDNYRLIIATK